MRFYLLLDVSVNVLARDRNIEKWFFASVISLCTDAAPSPDVTPTPSPKNLPDFLLLLFYFILFLRDGGSVHKLFGS